MVNRSLFQSLVGKLKPVSGHNEAGGTAHTFDSKHALAQMAVTGCFGDVFYANAETQLDSVLQLAHQVDDVFLAKLAIYARQTGAMKDMPALLVAILTQRKSEHLETAFGQVIQNGKMLRNYVQMVRSGVTGRRSLGSRPKRLIQNWLNSKSLNGLFADAVGQQPSLADVIKMVHPKALDPAREALYGYLIGKVAESEALPEVVQAYEAFKNGTSQSLPDLPFQKLTALPLTQADWVLIAQRAAWHMTRMNLNTFARHGVFEVPGMAELIAQRLADPKAVRKAKPFPYQLMVAFEQADAAVPMIVKSALQDAMEIATENVPAWPGRVAVLVDVSGSMGSPVSGYRKGATSTVRCVDVAALIAACVLRKNPDAIVMPFDTQVHKATLNPRDTVLTNAARLAKFGGGGTNCALGLEALNKNRTPIDLVLMVSDNESWIHSKRQYTQTQIEWEKLKKANSKAKLVCLDIQPYTSSQVPNQPDILNIGGFSDSVFQVIADFAAGRSAHEWVQQIEAIPLSETA
ncbi:MAG: TROVE domain-containing protein [Acidobacteria bacterium]|nr:TROVE domain-containing protein [Acidobacteriota bacterium]